MTEIHRTRIPSLPACQIGAMPIRNVEKLYEPVKCAPLGVHPILPQSLADLFFRTWQIGREENMISKDRSAP